MNRIVKVGVMALMGAVMGVSYGADKGVKAMKPPKGANAAVVQAEKMVAALDEAERRYRDMKLAAQRNYREATKEDHEKMSAQMRELHQKYKADLQCEAAVEARRKVHVAYMEATRKAREQYKRDLEKVEAWYKQAKAAK